MRVRLNAFLISIMITVLIFTSIAGIGTAQSSIPKPSVPEFTVKLVSYPYDVPPTTTTTVDPYTGKETVTTQPGYHVENKSIELIIKNQPVTPHTDAEGHMINLYYNVRVKGHFEDPWRELYSIDELMREERGAHKQGPVQSSFEYTVISCSADYPDDGEVDFQVQALAGYYTEWWPALGGPVKWYFTGQTSDWSNTQTIRMSDGTVSVSTSPNPTESPTATPSQEPAVIKDQTGAQSAVTQSGIDWTEISLFAALGVIVALLAVIALVHRNRKRGSRSDLLSAKYTNRR
ncbi:MAG: hypothetical protein QM398_07025 [Thermoproteota archaeon]|nr:hypothetical protein [Thermoproteota archaeon]NLD66299.1 hypothetical protein [Thermoproteota archaeon]